MPSSRASEPGEQGTEPEAADAPATAEAPEDDHATALARMEDRYKRALADLDNYRKRSTREFERRVGERRDALLLEWLEVVDGIERALRQKPDKPLYEGLRAVLDQMESILARQGVRRIGEAGEPFDPERHDVVEVRETEDVADRTVLEVTRSGFARDDHLLRPAQVVVARRPHGEG